MTISNSVFSGGNSDGVQITGNANGVVVGPGNEFFNLAQSSATHTDSIQLYGASDTTITGNYIHDAAEGIMAPDGGDSGFLHIENNVFSRIDQQGVYLGFKPGLVLNHNTFAAGLMLHDDPAKGGSPTVGAIIKNNILLDGVAKQNLMANAIAQSRTTTCLAGGIRRPRHQERASRRSPAGPRRRPSRACCSPRQRRGQGGRRRADMGITPLPIPWHGGAGAGAGEAGGQPAMRRGGAPSDQHQAPDGRLAVQPHAQGRGDGQGQQRHRPRRLLARPTTGSGPTARRPTSCGSRCPRARASARTR